MRPLGTYTEKTLTSPHVAATAALLSLVVLTASFWPARRAASVDPMRAMRAD